MMPEPTVAPIIILGMHRSGTSLVTRELERLGLFTGWRKEHNHEALFFLKANAWLLRQSGGAWDHPGPMRWLLEHEPNRRVAGKYLDLLLRSPWVMAYLGPGRYLRCQDPRRLGGPWGWKDPRNTFTLPIWLDLFPEARVIHVYRHGVDVAASLRTRARRDEGWLEDFERKLDRRKLWYTLRPKWISTTETLRCGDLATNFALWESYMHEAEGHVWRMGERAMSVCYEDFLAEPEPMLARLAAFCGLAEARSGARREPLKPGRAYAYREDPELAAFASSVADRLAAFGYHEPLAVKADAKPQGQED